MKIPKVLKWILYFVLFAVYGTGLIYWILKNWAQKDYGMGPEAWHGSIWFLQSHSILGLGFLILFGYLIHSHIEKGLRTKKKTKSGLFLLSVFVILILTVPFLFYLNDENKKLQIALIHTYLGLFLILPFVVHLKTQLRKTELRSWRD